MARPPKEGLDYFPHDCGAADDTDKVQVMRLLYGNDGYAFYFIALETIYKLRDQELDISDAENRQILQQKCMVDEQKFEKMLATALKRGLFDKEYYERTGMLTSNGIKKRSAIVLKKRTSQAERDEQQRQNKKAGTDIPAAETPEEIPPEMPIIPEETPPEMPERKEKKRKELIGVGVEEIVRQEQEARIYSFYQKNIGLLAPHQAEVIASYLTDGIEPEAILEILKDAVGKDTPWDWIKKVLNATFERGIKNLEQYKAHKLERETRDKKRGKRNGRTEGHSGQDSEDAGSKENGIDDRYQFPLPGEPGTGTEA